MLKSNEISFYPLDNLFLITAFSYVLVGISNGTAVSKLYEKLLGFIHQSLRQLPNFCGVPIWDDVYVFWGISDDV